MKDWTAIRERYLRDDLAIRLGGLAANMARIASFSDHVGHQSAVKDILVESEYFIEWLAPDASLEVQAELVNLQVQLARWVVRLEQDWLDVEARRQMASLAKQSSQEILQRSGLLNEKETTEVTGS